MSYARLPTIVEDKEEDKQEQIFKKPPPQENTQIEDKPQTTQLTEQEQKQKSLKEHLARCRAKSIEVRKAKKAEKEKNKKPRGRPRKVKQEASPLQEEFKPNVNLEVKEEYDPKTHRINEVVKEVKEEVKELQPPPSNNMDLDYEKLADMVAGRLKPKQNLPPANNTLQQKAPPQLNKPVVQNQQQVGNFLNSYADLIRQQERQKIKQEREEKQKQNLNNATRSYYSKLPPVNLIQSDNAWDNLFNGKR
tara:strand:+ start:862 stop:1608 length:747 start_codon:yes stop_codon:yes gene_type:complete